MPEAIPAVTAPSATQVVAAVVAEKTAEAAAPVVETAAPVVAAVEKKPEPQDSMAPRFQALARETKRLADEKRALALDKQKMLAEVKAERDAIAAARTEAEEVRSLRKNAAQDPEAFFKGMLGDDYYDKLTEMRLSGRRPAELGLQALREETKAEIERARKENEERWAKREEERKSQTEAETVRVRAEQDAMVSQFREGIGSFIAANADKYDFIARSQNEHLVWTVIEQTAVKTTVRDPDSGRIIRPGRVMSVEEAADAVEKHLEEAIYSGKKWAARLTAEQQKKVEPPSHSAKTLTNDGTSGTASPADLASMDRYERAVAAGWGAQK